MKRRLTLLAGTFLAIAAACGVYALVVGSGRDDRDGKSRAPRVTRTVQGPAAAGSLEGESPRLVDRDDRGRLRWILTADDSRRQEDGTYVLTRPKAVLYQSGGETIQITADEGYVAVRSAGAGGDVLRTEEVGSGFRVRQGSLKGNVKLRYDRSTDPNRPAVELREGQGDVLTVVTDDIFFDNDRLMLQTDGRVVVHSQEMELTGSGLSLRWNEDPQELRVLRLERGEGMTIRYPKSQEPRFMTVAVPTVTAADVEAGGQAVASDSATAATITPATAPAAAPATAPATAEWRQILASVATPTTGPTPHGKAQNRHRAVFNGNVVVRQGQRRLQGADELAAEFEWVSSSRSSSSQQPTAPPPQAGRVDDSSLVAAVDAEPLPAAATQPTVAQTRPQVEMSEPVTITWTGALEITPCGYVEKPSRKNVAVSGRGSGDIKLSDGQTVAHCREFGFSRHGSDEGEWQQGRLGGPLDAPARVTTTAGEEVVCTSMLFALTPRGDVASLRGPGYVGRAGDLPPPATGASAPSSAPVTGDRIAWTGGVDAKLARQHGSQDQARLYVTEAAFTGQVALTSADPSEKLSCENLYVWMGQDGGRQYVERALAWDKVAGRQGSEEVAADRLDVAFDRQRIEAGKFRANVETVVGEGNVSISGGASDRRWTAAANHLQANALAGTAVLTGAPASLTQQDGKLTGDTIHFHAFQDPRGSLIRGAGLAWVEGRGTLNMMMDNDFSGRKLAKPQPAEITWSDEMRYADWKGEAGPVRQAPPGAPPAVASFKGDVRLSSGGDEMTCGLMQAAFNEPAPSGEPSAPAGSAAGAQPRDAFVDLGAVSYGGSLSVVHATEGVMLRSRRYDEKDHLLGWAELHTAALTYDAAGKTMDSPGGTLMVLDVRPPKEETQPVASESQSALPTGEVERPSQTYFEWTQSMRLVMADRMVQLAGDVVMMHRSGDKIVQQQALRKDWNIADWPERLPSGRATDLRCNDLLARFAAQDRPSGASAPAKEDELETGLNVVGPLDVFLATGSVLLRDDPWEVIGQRLRYDRASDLVSVYGFLEGQRQTDAKITRKGSGTNSSPWIRWYRKNERLARMQDRIETGPMTGSGVVPPRGTRR